MIVEYIRYQVAPEREAAFLSAYRSAQPSLQASSQCLGYEITRCTKEPGRFVVRILWASAEGHLKGFRTSEHFGPFFKAVQPFFGDIQEMEHYALTESVWSRSDSKSAKHPDGQPE